MAVTGIVALLLMFIVELDVLLCMPVDQELQLSLLRVSDCSVLVAWKGPEVGDIKDCEVVHHPINSTILEETVEWILPLGYTIKVDDLLPLTAYQLHMICHTVHEVTFSSKHLNFTTATAGFSVSYRAVSHPVSISGTQPSSASTKVPVLQEKMSSSTSSLDLVLGVLFACMGTGVLMTATYFLLKKYRRHQRIRRFLQYRQHEDDSFTDLRQDGDERVVM